MGVSLPALLYLLRVTASLAQLQELSRIAPEDFFLVGFWNVEITDQLDGARLERRERRSIAAVEDAIRPHPFEHHLHRRLVVGDAVDVEPLHILAWLSLYLHRLVRTEEERLVTHL